MVNSTKRFRRKYLGNHLIAEFWRGKIIEDEKKLKEILFEAVRKSSNTPLKFSFHKFNPRGITGVVLLAESHIAFHTWPEFNYLGIDIFTCGEKASFLNVLEYLKAVFKPKRVEVREIKRGILR